jgi:hypothetical protein
MRLLASIENLMFLDVCGNYFHLNGFRFKITIREETRQLGKIDKIGSWILLILPAQFD